jgi:hypothetical protein
MNKAFPHFGRPLGGGLISLSRAPDSIATALTQASIVRSASRQAIFVPLLAFERDLQMDMTVSLLSRRPALGASMATLLRSHHAQVGAMVYILSQQYELAAGLASTLASDRHRGAAMPASKSSLSHRTSLLGTLIGRHLEIIRNIEGLARKFSGTVRDAMVLGHIAQRHREMCGTLSALLDRWSAKTA